MPGPARSAPLTDHEAALEAIAELPLDERAQALADIHEDLSAVLRETGG
ncbi:hypothetical protein ACSL103130_10665 [Actinomyces slackii]|uniref:Uncharacterized protein n=1 Tax=Actinomyces slackii TaxID=52774 RepID=A0A448KEV5_9ACTO|nr:hypothetical protein [Actinomyces slackii]VEG75456.1 Uncharacterised protein [Actinomyces slackii]